MRRVLLILGSVLAAAACDRGEAPPETTAAVETSAAAQPPAAPSGSAAAPGTTLPPAQSAARYVGGWAASAEACAAPPWRFEPRRLSTAGEVSCEFERVTPRPDGYDVDALCVAQAPPERHRLRLTFAESARAMTVKGGPFGAPVGLVYCGPLPLNG